MRVKLNNPFLMIFMYAGFTVLFGILKELTWKYFVLCMIWWVLFSEWRIEE